MEKETMVGNLDLAQFLEEREEFFYRRHLGFLDYFGGAVTHDFNNLLGAMKGYAEIASCHPEDQALVARALDAILRGTKHACALVKRMEILIRHDDDEDADYDMLEGVAEDVLALSQTLLLHQGIKAEMMREDSLRLRLFHGQIRVALIELIHNACDALSVLPRPERWLRVRCRRDGLEWAEISVENGGESPGPEVIALAGTPYYSTKHVLGGGSDPHCRGVGLAIVRKVALKHNGSFRLEALPEGGTAARLRLPLQPEIKHLEKRRIMLVEDDPAVSRIFQKVLTDAGYLVEHCEDGQYAWESLVKSLPDVMILDQQMPRMSGIELLGKMKDAGVKLPVVMVTANMNPDLARRALALGARCVTYKPLGRERLLFLIKRNLAEWKSGAAEESVPVIIGARILVLDSDSFVRDVVCFCLERAGHHTAQASSLVEAEGLLSRNSFDIIMLDAELHDTPIAEAVRRLNDRNPYAPILMMGCQFDSKAIRSALEGGAMAVLQKPLDAQELVKEVNRISAMFSANEI